MKLWLLAVRDPLPERQEKSTKQLILQREDENQTDNIRHRELLFHFGFFQQRHSDKMAAVRREEESLRRREPPDDTRQTGSAGGSPGTAEEASRGSARVSRPSPTITSRRPTSFYQRRRPFFSMMDLLWFHLELFLFSELIRLQQEHPDTQSWFCSFLSSADRLNRFSRRIATVLEKGKARSVRGEVLT